MIYGKVGRLGHGKTMRMVVDGLALRELRAKRGVCWLAANIRVNVPDGVVFRQLPMDGFSDALADLMAEARSAGAGLVVLVDEVDEVWGATDWQSVRKGDRHRIKQSRKYGVDLFVTAQFVDQIEKSIRNIMEEVELLRAYPSPSIQRRESGKRPWLIRGQRFRPGAVRELTAEPEKDRRLGSSWHRYRRDHELLYDTDEIIEPVNAEALCARHQKEIREDRCPMCHPQPSALAIAELVASAEETAA